MCDRLHDRLESLAAHLRKQETAARAHMRGATTVAEINLWDGRADGYKASADMLAGILVAHDLAGLTS